VRRKRCATAAGTLGVLLSGVAAGCNEDVVLPTPPMADETARLVALYEMPTAVLDTSNIEQARADAQARLDELNLAWLPDLVSQVLTRLRQRLDDSGLPQDPAETPDPRFAQLTAVVEVDRICAGWEDPAGPPDASANGSINVTGIVDTGRINPEIWGTATACKARFPPATSSSALTPITPSVLEATLDGTLIIYLLGPPPRTGTDARFLLTFTGMLGTDDQVRSASFDFEVHDTSIKFRVPAGGGDAIVTVGTTLGIQGANAGFACDLTQLTCQKAGG